MTGSRRPGLQGSWRYVVDSLDSIVPIYEAGSSRISLFADDAMRNDVVRSAVKGDGRLVLDLGSGPGTLARKVASAGGVPVLVDASRRMLLRAGDGFERVQCVFENLPVRDGTFDAVVAGFSLRDSQDLAAALGEVRRVVRANGVFSFCDLGKPDSAIKSVALAYYLLAAVPLIGLLSGGRAGLGFASLYETYRLTLRNGQLARMLGVYFGSVSMAAKQLGGAIVVSCRAQTIIPREPHRIP
jgi:demethylmenaquinone methyltransferase / 2-methoxy-6-polyprenyl-1,4-benzoquinol methylase